MTLAHTTNNIGLSIRVTSVLNALHFKLPTAQSGLKPTLPDSEHFPVQPIHADLKSQPCQYMNRNPDPAD
ncbi:hypothetical protein L1D24_05150 [Vibrio brasiliensis]|uniref:hypothetical protein n=1 Tax=Vibrio brasiliensis TaxID=170652 RepID=UPI001EFE6C66|nr:hypothetical protein [Vibrio brasiliensis]MCG9647958.1 hypothetical protein [Vibrio brasiliensis]